MTRGNEIYVGSLPLIFQPNLLPSGLSVVNRGAGNPWGQISYSSCACRNFFWDRFLKELRQKAQSGNQAF